MDSPTSAEAQARRLETSIAEISALVQQPENAQRLRTAPSENEWNVLQLLGHISEMIPYWLHEIRIIIENSSAELPRIGRSADDPERLAGVEHGAKGNPDQLLAEVQEEGREGAAAIRAFTPEERAKKGLSARWGEITVSDMLERFIVAHAEEHVRQMRQALQSRDE
ncbi:MAG TPA: DinB family protein [Anaerolineae bacterium]|nr:DinB family protein [Anaerolineae bacterium]